jgi:hypothetical protein
MTLKEIREIWEKHLDLHGIITKDGQVYVILQDSSRDWVLNRYFNIGVEENWQVSVDENRVDIYTIMAALTKEFKGEYPDKVNWIAP